MEEQNFAQILSAQQSVGDCLLATVLEGPDQGRQLLLGGGQLLWPSAPSALLVRGMDVLGGMQSPDICILEGVRVFVQPLTAPVRLVVCGGGHVAQAVVRLAQVLGLSVCAWKIDRSLPQPWSKLVLRRCFWVPMLKICPGCRAARGTAMLY